ncbi:MAG: RNA polymerase sigma factor [Clostridiales bacterium]|nr:RNA polymerase sigma factor [Clostridiales bacterium]
MKNDDVIGLFDAYADDLYRFAVSYVGTKHDAEDIVQDVFVKLLSKHVLFFDKKSEKSYLMSMIANQCKDFLKASARKTSVDLESAEWQLVGSDEFSERDRDVFDELMRLDHTYRTPIFLHYYEGYSYKEISKILKISESAAAMRIKRGKEQLRFRLEEET